jgi:hypothetical protein
MPILDPITPPESLSVVSSAVLFALLDKILERHILSRAEIQEVLQTAGCAIGARAQSPSGPKALDLMATLTRHFAQS